jgi:hypothetical protein
MADKYEETYNIETIVMTIKTPIHILSDSLFAIITSLALTYSIEGA